jgi:hypothetical protein
MAGNFIKELLAEKATKARSEKKPLSDTLKELFEVFFPDKEFLGPQPTADGSLDFPVRTQNGSVHDLDELSSGEKEIFYGYLRIRSSAPQNSIILLDEPELHLNPRLIRGLPEFYRKHLGEMLSNQLWLVTHSDALIREAVGKPGFSVFHMLPSGSEAGGENQLKELSISGDLDAALADLVGDLAAYRPGGKGVIFEGGGDSDFDKTMVSRLFAEELRGINLISGSNKARVRQLHEVLDRAYRKGDLKTKFYAIMDRDSGSEQESAAVGRYHWDVYHIENYLLDAQIIADVLNSLGMNSKFTAVSVEESLKIAARQVVPSVLSQRLRAHANSLLVNCINIAFSPDRAEVGKEVHQASQRSVQRIGEIAAEQLTEKHLVDLERLFTDEIEASFSSGRWRVDLPGRDVLRRLCSQVASPVGYEVLRNLIVAEMVNRGHKPPAMLGVIRRIVES